MRAPYSHVYRHPALYVFGENLLAPSGTHGQCSICTQSAHKLYSEAPEVSPEELGQARLTRGLGSLLAGRTSLRLAYAQKMAGLPLTIPEETTAEAEAQAQLHDSHYETMWSTQHSRGNILDTQFESPLDTIIDSRDADSAASGPSAGNSLTAGNELYYVSAPDSLGMALYPARPPERVRWRTCHSSFPLPFWQVAAQCTDRAASFRSSKLCKASSKASLQNPLLSNSHHESLSLAQTY